MKKFVSFLLLSALLVPLAAFADEPAAGESAAPAEAASLEAPAAAVELAKAYLAALGENDIDRAMALVDMRSMRESLLATRLADLKRHDPSLTDVQLAEIEKNLLVRELAPERLDGVLRTILRNTRGTGDFSAVLSQAHPVTGEGANPVAAGEEAYVFVADVTRDGTKGMVPVPVRRYGEDWQVALDLAEALPPPRGRVPQVIQLPEGAQEAVDGFWTVWKEGSPAATYEMLAPAQRPALAAYTAETAAFTGKIGAVVSWSQNAPAREIAPGLLATGFLVKGEKAESSCVMVLENRANAWTVSKVLFGPPAAAAPEAPKPLDFGPSAAPALTPPPAPEAE